MKTAHFITVTLHILLSCASPALALPGDLDASFGIGGKVTTPVGSGDDRGHAMVMQGDGKLVVAGYSYNGSNNDFAVTRYNADGTLDTTFNATGKVTTDFGGSNDIANGVAVQSDDKIIVVGGSLTGSSRVFALARYNTDGTLDTSFGPALTGKIKTTIGQTNANTQARSVKVQADGKILVAGYAFPNGYDFALLRYNSDGTLDEGFGAGGLVTPDAGSYEYGHSVALQSDGKIVVAGSLNELHFLAVRHNSDGTLDNSFGTSGKVYVNGIGGGGNTCYEVAVQGDGKIVLAGSAGNIGSRDFRLVRLTASGSLDATFGTAGVVTSGIGTADDVAYTLAVQNDGKLVMAGYSHNGGTGFSDFALVRYNDNGSLDTSFQSTGKVMTPFTGGSAVGSALVIGSDGRIVVAGYAHDGTSNNFALARYFPAGNLFTSAPANGSHTANSQPVISGQANANFTVNVYLDGNVVGTTLADGVGAWSFTPTAPLADGTHTLAVSETDGMGSTGQLTNVVSFTVDTGAPAAPMIVSPAENAVVSSRWPLISGTAEALATVVVYFDNTAVGSVTASGSGNWSYTAVTALSNGAHTVKARATDRAANTGDFSETVTFSTAAPLFGGPGSLDSNFGIGGKVTTPIGNGADAGNAVAMQSDGKLVVAGHSYNGTNNDFAVVRYHADGTLDTTFNGTGKITTDFGGSNDVAYGVALQSDGKIIAVGGALTGSSQVFALARYHPNGTLDSSFGALGTGRIKTTIGQTNANTQARSIKIQPDDKILVAGYAFPNGYDFALLRYNSDGTLDNGFGIGGLVTPDAGSYEYGHSVALQSDGKIIVAGSFNGLQFMVVRHNADGALDPSFGTSGKAFVNGIGGGGNFCYQVAVQDDGKIVLAGSAGNIGARDFRLARFTTSGVLDTSFGTAGVVNSGIGTADDVAYSLAVQSDGKLVAAGYAFDANTGFTDFAVVRYNSNGTLDASFLSTGKVMTAFGGGSAVGNAMVIASDGRIVVAGSAHDGISNNFALARYFGTDQPPLATTGDATGIVRAGAVLNGTVNPNSLATTAYFQYGTTTSYGSTSSSVNLGNGYLAAPTAITIGGLTDNTLYHYRLVATNAAGTTFGADATFTTAPNPPLAFTGDAANVSASGATLVGVVLPNGRDTTAYFEFGLSTAYGTQTDSQFVPATGTIENVFASLTGLVSGATYHFRLVAINAGSPIPITGVDKTFVAQAPAPVVTLGAAVPLTTTSVGLSGTVNANGASTQVFFDYGTDGTTFPNSVTASPATVTGTSSTAVTGAFVSLSQGVTYHYRLRAVSAGGETLSSVASFSLDLLSGLTQVFPGAVPEAEGSLIVNLTPTGILHGWRFIGEQQWRAPGVAVGGLATGDREIEFRPVPGYIHPPAEATVNVISGGATTIITRDYYETAVTGSGGLSVTLKPDSIILGPDRAQWRLLGEDDEDWRDSGAALTGLIPGSYLVECKPVTGRATPPNANVIISASQTAAPTITYFLASTATGALPSVLAFETVTTDQTKPYAHVGQIRSNVGASSGFAVKERVVATAAHVVWDDGTLSAAQGLQWLFQRHRGTYEPQPQAPRGFYLLAGYAAQRQAENSPGSFSPQSRNLDVAAMYFLASAARGGHGGFLASDLDANDFLLSNANKMLVGYPVDGIASGSQGRMHATAPGNIIFSALGTAANRTYLTTGIRSTGGASGGPLCVQFDGGNYYPAAIYLGGTEQTLVRAIDSAVIDLFNRAELSGIDDLPHTSGGITHTSVSNISSGSAGALKVIIEPAGARNAGAGWRLAPEMTYRISGAQKSSLNAGTYVLQLPTVPGFEATEPQSVSVTAGSLSEITFTYVTLQESWRQAYFGSTANSGNGADTFDFDGDGFTNAAEYAAGTNPTLASDRLLAHNPQRSGNSFSVTTDGKSGRTYFLERSTNLSGWTTVSSQGPLSYDAPVTLTDATTPGTAGFYRVRVTGPVN